VHQDSERRAARRCVGVVSHTFRLATCPVCVSTVRPCCRLFCPARSGGQSNMEFSVAEAFGYDGAVGGLIPTADKPGLRLFAIQKNQSDTPLAEAVDLQYPEGWVRSTPATACGAEYKNNGYNPPSNTTAYCGPHCGPSAVVRKTPFGGPFQYKNDQFNKTGSGQTYGR
jgi:hypothetical protein